MDIASPPFQIFDEIFDGSDGQNHQQWNESNLEQGDESDTEATIHRSNTVFEMALITGTQLSPIRMAK